MYIRVLISLLTMIEIRPVITLQQLNVRVFVEFQKTIAISALAKTVHGKYYSIKSVHNQPVSTKSQEWKIASASYVTKLRQIISPVCARSVQLLPSSRDPNVYLIGATSRFFQLKFC